MHVSVQKIGLVEWQHISTGRRARRGSRLEATQTQHGPAPAPRLGNCRALRIGNESGWRQRVHASMCVCMRVFARVCLCVHTLILACLKLAELDDAASRPTRGVHWLCACAVGTFFLPERRPSNAAVQSRPCQAEARCTLKWRGLSSLRRAGSLGLFST